MGHPIHKHMHTHITKQNVKAAIRDDKAHMDYLKRDVKDDQRAGGKYKDINQTADEKHISKLAGDVKYDEKKEGMSRYKDEGMSRYEYEGMSRMHSPLNVGPDAASKKKYSFGEKLLGTAKNIGDRIAMVPNKLAYGGKTKEDVMKNRAHNQYSHPDQGHNFDIAKADMKMRTDRIKKRKDEGSAFFRHTSEHSTEEYMARKDAAIKKSKGMSRYSSPVNNITYGDKSGKTGYIGQERYDLNEYNPVDDRAGSPAKNMDHDKMKGKERFDHMMVEHPAKPPKRDGGKRNDARKVQPKGEREYGGMSRKKKKSTGLPLGMTKEELGRSIRTAEGKETKRDKRRNKRDTKRTMRYVKKHGSGLKMD